MVSCNFWTLKVLLIACVFSTAFFIVSFVLAFKVFPDVVDSEIAKATRLELDTDQYERFEELPFDLDLKVYLFGIGNADELKTNPSAKPRMEEVGPFIFKEHRTKEIVGVFSDTISYYQNLTFRPDEENSENLDTELTILNPALMSIYQLAENFFLATKVEECISSTFEDGNGDIFVTVKARELLFEGFNFCNVKFNNEICDALNYLVCQIASEKRNVDIEEDQSLRFSYLNYKTKYDGKYTVKRGMDDIERLGFITKWNDKSSTDFWREGSSCNEVKGTDSTIYPPHVTEDTSFFIYATDICRFVEINYVGEGTYKEVDGYYFSTNPKTLYSSTSEPEDDCFCLQETRGPDGQSTCFLDGVLDNQNCFGVPVILSFPHFLWAEKYQNAIDGMQPEEDKHKIFLLIEPNTGTPLQGARRVQFNTVMRPIFGVDSTQDLQRTVIPLVWIDEGVALPQKYVDLINDMYFDRLPILDGVKWALIAVSSVIEVVVLFFVARKWKQSRKASIQ